MTRVSGTPAEVPDSRYLDLDVEGQLSDLPRKSIEPMADTVGEPPRNLQQFLSLFRWDQAALRDRLQQHVARRHTHQHSVGVFDETSFVKKGDSLLYRYVSCCAPYDMEFEKYRTKIQRA